jgi:hypothetical protein
MQESASIHNCQEIEPMIIEGFGTSILCSIFCSAGRLRSKSQFNLPPEGRIATDRKKSSVVCTRRTEDFFRSVCNSLITSKKSPFGQYGEIRPGDRTRGRPGGNAWGHHHGRGVSKSQNIEHRIEVPNPSNVFPIFLDACSMYMRLSMYASVHVQHGKICICTYTTYIHTQKYTFTWKNHRLLRLQQKPYIIHNIQMRADMLFHAKTSVVMHKH